MIHNKIPMQKGHRRQKTMKLAINTIGSDIYAICCLTVRKVAK